MSHSLVRPLAAAATLSVALGALADPTPPAVPHAPRAPHVMKSVVGTAPGASSMDVRVDDRRITFNQDPAPDKPWLGILLEKTEGGILVLSVADGSPADAAGLRPGDLITRVGERTVTEAGGLLEGYEVGDRATFVIERDGNVRRLRARLDTRPDGPVSFDVPEGMDMPPIAPTPPAAPAMPFRFFHEAQKPRLGISLGQLSEQLADYFGVEPGEGVLVESVKDDTPAQRGGLRAGDVIVGLGDEAVSSVSDIRRVLREYDEGERVPVDVVRRGNAMTLSVVLDTPAPQGDRGTLEGMEWRFHAPDAQGVEKLVRAALERAGASSGEALLEGDELRVLLESLRANAPNADDRPRGAHLLRVPDGSVTIGTNDPDAMKRSEADRDTAPDAVVPAPAGTSLPAWAARTPSGAWIF